MALSLLLEGGEDFVEVTLVAGRQPGAIFCHDLFCRKVAPALGNGASRIGLTAGCDIGHAERKQLQERQGLPRSLKGPDVRCQRFARRALARAITSAALTRT
jgi:hypothetical protein